MNILKKPEPKCFRHDSSVHFLATIAALGQALIPFDKAEKIGIGAGPLAIVFAKIKQGRDDHPTLRVLPVLAQQTFAFDLKQLERGLLQLLIDGHVIGADSTPSR